MHAQLEAIDLAALLCSRVCHDVVGPVGAIVNGLEVLDEEKDEGMRAFAFDMIRKSARQASARLQFARIAFGAAGSAGASIDTGDAEQVARGMFHDDKIRLSWQAPRLLMPKNKVKLLLNLIVIATSCIPRGGSVAVLVEGDSDTAVFDILSQGLNARIPANVMQLLAGTPEGGAVDAHAIQPFFTGLISRAAGMTTDMTLDGDKVRIIAKSTAAA